MTKENNNSTSKKVHRVEVDRLTCISAGTCVVVSPDAFELDESEIAVVKEGAETLSDSELLLAAQSCPTQAIFLFDENGTRIFPK